MLRPVDLTTVFAHDRVHGTDYGPVDTPHADQVHTGLAWWIGACLVLTANTRAVALVHDGTPLAHNYARAFAQGAINVHPNAAVVSIVAPGAMPELIHAAMALAAPGVLMTTVDRQITIQLIDPSGAAITMESGLGPIRDLIAADRTPRPVDTAFKGRIEQRPDLLPATSNRTEHP
ncbi:hypothetical protein [Kineosporia sp. NBRC 101731]|uniref:hypothetical protein n=1 Tax=Kineosporia sp. NBRC 101731 TaxID=3032199 RepID=UPI00249FFF08|nr:hypothetical protein [Kineosporia sp. NBRC 101731]GLY33464.1 hypothetical protein Kisp02_68290 [Kineosporia sp. NBRC 101731]